MDNRRDLALKHRDYLTDLHRGIVPYDKLKLEDIVAYYANLADKSFGERKLLDATLVMLDNRPNEHIEYGKLRLVKG